MGDVARLAGVSKATVSRVLNEHPRVSPEIATRVRRVLADTRYTPAAAGRALRRRKADLLAAIVPDINNPFFSALVDAFEKSAQETGFSVVLCNTGEDELRERKAVESVVAHSVSGVVLAPTIRTSVGSLAPLLDANIPVVTVDREIHGFEGDSVNVDNRMLGVLAAEHVISQHGRVPLVISHVDRIQPLVDRAEGFIQKMREEGRDITDENVLEINIRDPLGPLRIAEHAARVKTDSVFAVTNPLTADAYEGLRQSGLRIGCDVALVGVDDDRWNRLVETPVTVLEQPTSNLGEWAARLLAARAKGSTVGHARLLLDPSLVIRASSLGCATCVQRETGGCSRSERVYPHQAESGSESYTS